MNEIIANEIDFTYAGGAHAIKGVSAEIGEGKVTAIVGPNGSGKSTLLKILSGILRGDSGEVKVCGRYRREISRSELSKIIGFLPQDATPAFELCAWEVVMTGRYPHLGVLGLESAVDAEIARRVMMETHTYEFKDRLFSTLSGGEKKRVLISAVLAQEPLIMLLDEPTAALDIRFQAEVFELLRGVARAGIAVGVVTHDLNMASIYADKLYLMSCGTVASSGSPREVVKKDILEKVYETSLVLFNHDGVVAPIVLPDAGRGGAAK